MEDLKEGLVIPGFLFVDEAYKALPLTAKLVLGLLIGRIRPDEEAAGEAVACIKQDDVGAILDNHAQLIDGPCNAWQVVG